MLAASIGSTQTTGVARSLELLEQKPEVARTKAFGVQDRVLGPMLDRMLGLAVRLSPSGTGTRIGRSLDRAGNSSGVDRRTAVGAKGLFVVITIIALLVMGFSIKGLLAPAAPASRLLLPDVLVYNVGVKRQTELSVVSPTPSTC